MITEPNSAIPAGLRKRPALDADTLAGAKGHAAGCLFVAPDGDVLLLRRGSNEENFAGHWALPGGNMDEGEEPEQGLDREIGEEMGVKIDGGGKKLLDQRATPTGKVFHTYAQPVTEKFAPKLNGEHSGYAWAPLNMLPQPLHPAIASTLKDRIGIDVTGDSAHEDWESKSHGFREWVKLADDEDDCATDSALKLALDKDSVREFDRDGRMKVSRANISKANVCPYKGSEIPNWHGLGLEPDRIYQLLRDPEELKKAAPSLNGVPLLKKHIPVSAEDHKPHDVVGSIGSNAEFDGEYLANSVYVNAKDSIDGIKNGKQRELSAGYHYTPDMTPGNFRGSAYDGVMRDIVFNHVALVEDGRAGPDVVIGDSTENLTMSKSTRLAAFTLGSITAQVAPLLALDAKCILPKTLFTPITSKNLKDHKAGILAGVRLGLDGKLRKGIALDATMEGVAKLLDAIEGTGAGVDTSLTEEQEKAMEAAAAGESDLAIAAANGENEEAERRNEGFDSAPILEHLRKKGMSEDDVTEVAGMFPKPAAKDESEESDEDKKKREEKERAEKDAKDAAMKDMVTKPAMDQAIKAAVAEVRKTEQGIRTAIASVKPWVGELKPGLAFDSAADVYRHALKARGMANVDKLHADALQPILEAMPKSGARPVDTGKTVLGMDEKATSEINEIAPGLARITGKAA